MNPFRTGQLVMFQVKYDRGWHFFEILFYIIIGVFGGLYGAFVIKWNLKMQVFRKKFLGNYPITEAVTLAVLTAIICYPNMFLRIDMTESMEILFQECREGHDYDKLCDREQRWHMIGSLAIATVIRTLLVIISFGCKVPAGIFVPSMAVGAAFGRMVGIFVQHIHESFPTSTFFNACDPDGPCITPGTYAFLGAAASLSGIMHISISVVVIMFEITGALTYILPTMVSTPPLPETALYILIRRPDRRRRNESCIGKVRPRWHRRPDDLSQRLPVPRLQRRPHLRRPRITMHVIPRRHSRCNRHAAQTH
jgi:chloride channel 3/4/5